MTDPFERVTIDLESALSELTESTRARLDDIGPVHDDARPVVARVAVAKVRPPARTLSAARLPSAPAPQDRSGLADVGDDEAGADEPEVSEPAPTAVPSRSATPHSPASVGFYSTVRLRPRVPSRPARVGLPTAPPAVEPVHTVEPALSAPVSEPAADLVPAPVDEPVLAPVLESAVAPVDAEPVDAEPVDVEPVEVEVEDEPVDDALLVAESVDVESVDDALLVAESVEDEPVGDDVADEVLVEPVDDEPLVAESVDVEPVEDESVDVESVDDDVADDVLVEPVQEEAARPEAPLVVARTRDTEPDVEADVEADADLDPHDDPGSDPGSDPGPDPARPREPGQAAVPTYAVAPRLLGRDRPLRQVAPPARSARRGAVLAAGGVAAAILVLVVGFLASGPLRDDATRQAVAPAALPAAPGAAPSPGRLTDIAVRSDGSVEVTEWLNLTSNVRSVRILPASARRARVSDAVVEGAGQAKIDLGGSAAPQVVTFDEGVDRVLVRYTVTGAVSLSAQDPDRALLDFPLLAMSAPRDSLSGPSVVRVRDALVLGAACGPSKASAEPCGMQRDRGWRVGKAAHPRSSVLLASLDLG